MADLADLRIDESERETGSGIGKYVIVVILIAGLTIAAVAAVLAGRPSKVEVIEAQSAMVGTSSAVLNASGYVTPRRRATVASKITGQIVEIDFEEGMRVEEGQVLARLDDVDARMRLIAARAQREVARAALGELQVALADAERSMRRVERLRRENVVSQAELDSAQAKVDSVEAQISLTEAQVLASEAQIAVARRDVENCVVKAPFAGIAISKDAQEGEMVSPVSAGGGYTRTGIATIVDMDSLEIEVDVNESYIARVSEGQRVKATLDAYPSWEIPCKVKAVVPTADRQKATVTVRIEFDELDPRILPDMGVKVTFLEQGATADTDHGAEETLTVRVPAAALHSRGDRAYLFVVEGEMVEQRAVSVAERRGSEAILESGIAIGETVVVASNGELEDGASVRVVRSGSLSR